MSAQIFQFPKLPARIPAGNLFTVEQADTDYVDVRERFANLIVARNQQPWWMRILSDHNDCDRSGR